MNKNELRKIKIYNEYGYGLGNVLIYYAPARTTRMGISSWEVYKEGVKLSTQWYNHGRKSFIVMRREDKQKILEEAVNFAKETFNIKEFEKTPFGGYMEKEFVEKRNKELKEQLKELKNTIKG
jgi:hypothetical protein